MSSCWVFYVEVKYEAPDQSGVLRQWQASEKVIGVGNAGMSEQEARRQAEGRLTQILAVYPKGATATLGAGYTYEEHLTDHLD